MILTKTPPEGRGVRFKKDYRDLEALIKTIKLSFERTQPEVLLELIILLSALAVQEATTSLASVSEFFM